MLPGPLLNESTWVGSVAVVRQGGAERMYTTYVCPSPGGAQGIAQWDDEEEVFKCGHQTAAGEGGEGVDGCALGLTLRC